MNEHEAAERFQAIRTKAEQLGAAADRDGAKSLLERTATLTDIEAVKHYVAAGEANLTLSERLQLAAAEAMAVAEFVAQLTGSAADREIETQRRRFQDMLVSRYNTIAGDPSERASALIVARAGQFNRVQAWLKLNTDTNAAGMLDALLEVAGITWGLAELVSQS